MTDAREVIARHLCAMAAQAWSGTSPFERASYRTTASGMVDAVTSAGLHILGPDEIDQLCEDIQVAVSSMTGDCKAHHKIALNHMDRAIRALKEKRT